MQLFKFEDKAPFLAIAGALIGVLLISISLASTSGFWFEQRIWIQILGATILGAGFTSIIAFPGYQRLLARTADVVSQGLVLPPDIDTNEIRKYNHRWHFYWMSEMDGRPFWRMVSIDLRTGFPGARLTSRIPLKNKNNKPEYYLVEAMARRQRLLMCFYPEVFETEPPMVAIFEVHAVDEIHVGTMNLMTWDHTHILSPCIVSKTPICGWRKEQEHVDEDTGQQLLEFWNSKRISSASHIS